MAAYAPDHAEENDDGDGGEGDEDVADRDGRGDSANMLKAAPVLRTWEMRKMPGMTVKVWPLGSCWATMCLDDAIEEDHQGGDGEHEAASVASAARWWVRRFVCCGHQASAPWCGRCGVGREVDGFEGFGAAQADGRIAGVLPTSSGKRQQRSHLLPLAGLA